MKTKRTSDDDNDGEGCCGTIMMFALFMAIGAALTIWGVFIVQNARASANWPGTPGQITESAIDVTTDAESDPSYSPQVAYTYQVNGTFYEGYRIKFGENTYSSEREALEILGMYPVGQTVMVYYDPADPDNTVLEPGVSGGSYIVLSVGVIFVVVSLAIIPFSLIPWLLKRFR